MRRTGSRLVLVVIAACLAAAPPALGQGRKAKRPAPAPAVAVPAADGQQQAREQARQLLQEGNRQLDQGLYLDALKTFRRAYDVFPSPKLHYNIAQTYNELGRPLEALHHYEEFVRAVKRAESEKQWTQANERIFKLQGAVATVQLQCNVVDAVVTIDGREVGRTPITAALRYLPGPHAVVVAKAGYEKQVVEVVLKPGDAITRRVQLLTEDEAAATKRAVLAAEARRRAALEQEWQTNARLERTRRILRRSGWSAVGVGLATVVTGGVFGIVAARESSKVEGAAFGTVWDAVKPNYKHAETYRQVMYYGVGIGAGVAIAGGIVAVWSYRGGRGERRSQDGPAPLGRFSAVPIATPQQIGFAFAGRF
jgi:tetratricopeptide (TPR) repeat protein